MRINLELVIFDAMHPGLDEKHWHHSTTGPDNASSRARQDITLLENNMGISTDEELPQGYGLFLQPKLEKQAVRKYANTFA